mmetsp:Transcript_11161/g.40928  ORF Transcript_11161/g.40928 Transcript_11161/m.40928 type:complete len:416 (-) Transcript_11161:862-2109(-)
MAWSDVVAQGERAVRGGGPNQLEAVHYSVQKYQESVSRCHDDNGETYLALKATKHLLTVPTNEKCAVPLALLCFRFLQAALDSTNSKVADILGDKKWPPRIEKAIRRLNHLEVTQQGVTLLKALAMERSTPHVQKALAVLAKHGFSMYSVERESAERAAAFAESEGTVHMDPEQLTSTSTLATSTPPSSNRSAAAATAGVAAAATPAFALATTPTPEDEAPGSARSRSRYQTTLTALGSLDHIDPDAPEPRSVQDVVESNSARRSERSEEDELAEVLELSRQEAAQQQQEERQLELELQEALVLSQLEQQEDQLRRAFAEESTEQANAEASIIEAKGGGPSMAFGTFGTFGEKPPSSTVADADNVGKAKGEATTGIEELLSMPGPSVAGPQQPQARSNVGFMGDAKINPETNPFA